MKKPKLKIGDIVVFVRYIGPRFVHSQGRVTKCELKDGDEWRYYIECQTANGPIVVDCDYSYIKAVLK